MHERFLADVCQRGTARRRWVSSIGVHALDEFGLRQSGSTGWSIQVSDNIEQDPGDGFLVDNGQSSGILVNLGPDGACIQMLPRGANHEIPIHPWIRVGLFRIGAEVVRDELLIMAIEQGGLRREEYVGEASARGLADIVLRAVGVTHKEWYETIFYLNVIGHLRRRDVVHSGGE